MYIQSVKKCIHILRYGIYTLLFEVVLDYRSNLWLNVRSKMTLIK
jgi:hypothetical protein